MKKSIRIFSLAFFLFLLVFAVKFESVAQINSNSQTSVPTPKQLWERFRNARAPLEYAIKKDEIVSSDILPGQKLRRIDFIFSSQEVPTENLSEMRKLWHQAVLFCPAEEESIKRPDRRGKVVIVGSLVGPYKQSFLSNYGDAIAVRTGYPTLVLPNPGEIKERPDQMYRQRWLIDYRKTNRDNTNHSHFRWAVPFLQSMDILAEILEIDKSDIRAIIGGHSKRATSAFTAAAIDPERIVGVVFMGNESLHPEGPSSPWWLVSPYYTQKFLSCPVFYIGATNEGGYAMFNINRIYSHMEKPWTFEIIPNYRHASESEKQFLDWQMWASHIFDGRPLTKISDLHLEETKDGIKFFVRIDSPNKIILSQVWYVYCDDVPYWRDLVWYPTVLHKKEKNIYEAYLPGKTPDAWLVEVQDTSYGFRGYVSSLPQDITHKPAETRSGRGFPRRWEPKKSDPKKRNGGNDE